MPNPSGARSRVSGAGTTSSRPQVGSLAYARKYYGHLAGLGAACSDDRMIPARLVKLEILPEGEKAIASGNTKHETVRYVVKVKIGGVAGLVAPLLGKQPPDTHVWVLTGNAPAFVKFEGPIYEGGPIGRIELATPVGF